MILTPKSLLAKILITIGKIEIRGGSTEILRKAYTATSVARIAMLEALDLLERDRLTTLGWVIAGELAAGRRCILHGCGDSSTRESR